MALFRGVESSLMSGSVLLDGVDTQKTSLGMLRNSLRCVRPSTWVLDTQGTSSAWSQTPFIWHAPLRHNLDTYGKCSDKDIWMTLERIGLCDAVEELLNKLETRQLLCLARVLLRGGKVVVLDEASSSLDLDTDKKIREVIRTDLAHATVVAVAHRIETIVDFDLILVMADGALVESGSPASLLAQSGTRFAQLAASQGVDTLRVVVFESWASDKH
ncbi:P-loop containing nucleoside triphosphate hydrolase protein [Mycena pura]|uniref:P-loop containing nucleoside triphosphate hydrolase protein n=1 Tax=Mycena pura TaxID=153505 RepID=A0AAD6YW30_9AGAR|nr:P-loop containing nucleoside triphosphate hydrolase protein [Mycena pura]